MGASRAPLNPFVTAEDVIHTPADFARGDLRALRWDSLDGRTGLRAAAASEGLYTSPVIRTNNPFSHVGLHWRTSGPQTDGLRFDVRTSSDGRTWSPWRHAEVETYPEENPRGESFAALVWAGDDGRFVQYTARFDAETQESPLLSYVTVTTLSAAPPSPILTAARTRKTKTPTPKATSTSSPAGPVSGAGALPPPIDDDYLLTREDWGAPDSYRFYTNGAEIWPRMYVPTKKIIVHHTATLDSPGVGADPSYTPDQAVQDVRVVYYYHAISKGWGDIGYNALIDRFGRVYEGRRGRDKGPDGKREIISPDVVAGHALNCNEGSAGVSLIGNFEVNRFDFAYLAPMHNSLLEILTWWSRRHYIDPKGSSDFLMVNYATVLNVPNICGHCNVNNTACPGRYAYACLPGWRNDVEDKVSDAAQVKPSVEITQTPSAADIARGYVTFSWKSKDSSAALFSCYLEGWIGNLDYDSVYYISGFTGDKRPAWSEFSSNTMASFTLKEPGRYTFHVRAKDPSSDNEGAYEANYTFVNSSAERTFYRIGAPGTTKN